MGLKVNWVQKKTSFLKNKISKRVLVIGAGASGLVTLKTLLQEGHDAICVEKESSLGGLFRHSAWESQQFVSSPLVTMFSDFLPEWVDATRYFFRDEFLRYLEDYCKHFALEYHIKFSKKVLSINSQKTPSGKWSVNIDGIGDELFDCIAICCGLHDVSSANHPSNLEKFKGQLIHSSQYKNQEPFFNKRVVVIGLGESASDISAEVSRAANHTTLLYQRGITVVPRFTPENLPNDWKTTRIRYSVPPFLQSFLHYLQFIIYSIQDDKIAADILQIMRQSGCGLYNQQATKSDEFIKAHLAGTLSLKNGRIIDVLDDGKTLKTNDGSFLTTDVIINATGFDAKFPFLPKYENTILNSLKLYKRFIPLEFDNDIAFIGFVRPHLGAIPPISEMQARLISGTWAGRIELPSKGDMKLDIHKQVIEYKSDFPLHYNRKFSLVQHIKYMDVLADIIGCRPIFRDCSWKALFLMICGPITPIMYRFSGPYANSKKAESLLLSRSQHIRGLMKTTIDLLLSILASPLQVVGLLSSSSAII